MPSRLNARSLSITSQESYKAVMIADLVAEVQEENPPPPPIILSKGVVLDAASLRTDVSPPPQKDTGAAERAPMSTLRKWALVASCSPAVLFVLGFAVIFPCEVPFSCGFQTDWSLSFNHTEFTHLVQISGKVLLASRDRVHCLDALSGQSLWEEGLSSAPFYIECGHGLRGAPKIDACLVAEESGLLQLFHLNNGSLLWYETGVGAAPAIVSDCDGDGREEIVYPLANNHIRLLFSSRADPADLELTPCTSSPTHLLTWNKNGTNDLLFLCDGRLMRISHEEWCSPKSTLKLGDIRVTRLLSNNIDFSEAKYLPTPDGLAVWTKNNTVTWLGTDGDLKWAYDALSHQDKNRFMVYGSLEQAKSQVILYSSDINYNFTVTGLNPENGNLSLSKMEPHVEIPILTHLRNAQHDFLIYFKRNLSGNEENPVQEKLILAHMDGSAVHSTPAQKLKGELKRSLITFENMLKPGSCRVMLLRVSSIGTSIVESVTIPNPETTVLSCLWK